jgi:hypothetical protein
VRKTNVPLREGQAQGQWQRQRQRQQQGTMRAWGYERIQGCTNEHRGRYERARAGMRGAQGVRTSAGGGVTNERRGVRTSAGGYERAQGGTNVAGAAVGATRPSSLVPPLTTIFFFFIV